MSIRAKIRASEEKKVTQTRNFVRESIIEKINISCTFMK
uniref:Ribosomal protein L22 n=1 Tax=Romanomermis culicivorax TaxID=13658 RepID=A0A915KZA0_ROMCU